MLNEQVVKVINISGGHNYKVGEFYTIGTPLSNSGNVKLLEIIKVPGILFTGNNIQSHDFEYIDVFSDNEEFIAFLKQREELIFNKILTDLKAAILLKEEIKQVAEFSSKEDYMIGSITKCKDALSDDEDEGCKQIVSLLASLT